MLTFLIVTMLVNGDSLAQPFVVKAGGKPIELKIGHAAPIFVDFDADGKKDLLVGEFGGGGVRYYRNVGTSEKPAFDKFEMVKAGGKPIKVESG